MAGLDHRGAVLGRQDARPVGVRKQERIPLGQEPHGRQAARTGARRALKVEGLATLFVAKPEQLPVQRVQSATNVSGAQTGELHEILQRRGPEGAEVGLDQESCRLGPLARTPPAPTRARGTPTASTAPASRTRSTARRRSAGNGGAAAGGRASPGSAPSA